MTLPRTPAIYLLVALLMAGSACTVVSDDFELLSFEAPPRPDTEPPKVIKTVPAQGATDVLRSQPIRICYDEAIDPSSFDLQDFTIDSEGDPLDIDFVYDPKFYCFEVYPDAPFEAYVSIRVTIPAGLTDGLGHTTAQPFVLEYSTGGQTDEEPPSFAGIVAASNNEDNSATLSWQAASDNFTPANRIRYRAFVGLTNIDFNDPAATSEAGATSMRVPYLLPGETYFFAIRAIDSSGNEDDNTAEQSATITGLGNSFAADVLPILQTSCAGASCHEGSDVPSRLDLVEGDVRANLVDQPSPADPSNTLVVPGEWRSSILALVLTGRQPSGYLPMPLVGELNQAEIDAIVNWIVQGAQDN